MRVLVTGGAGYIGGHTAKRLAASGYEPVTLDNLSAGHRSAVQWGPFVRGDIGDADMVRTVLHTYNIEAVVHLAASAYIGESVCNPRKYFDNNVTNSLKLFGAMLDVGVRRIVFSSTCAIYGQPRNLPITEDHPLDPINPYGESKLFVERVLQRYVDAYGLQAVVLRYFNAAGCDVEGDIGEDHSPETHIIPLTIEAALAETTHLDIFGVNYNTADGTAIRDYTHVMDLARAHVLALEYVIHGGDCHVFNLGTGKGHSIIEVVRTVEQVSGRCVPVNFAPRRPGDTDTLVADANKAARVLGWIPEYPDLESMVRSAWDWRAISRAARVASRR